MINVREDTPSKILEKHELPHDIKSIFIELTFRKVKWLLFGTYWPLQKNDQYYFGALDKTLDSYSGYDRVVWAGDLNTEEK